MSFLQDDVMNTILDHIWGDPGNITWTPPATWYIALFEVAPDPDGTGGTEASYTGYARAAVTNDLTNFPAAVNSLKENALLIDFGVAGSGPVDVVAIGWYDDPTSVLPANLWAVNDLAAAPVTINNGADVTIPIGAADLTNCL